MHSLSRSPFRLLAGLILLAALCCLPALAQNTGGVKGKIRNLRGDRIAGASVTARLNQKDIRTVTANDRGEFVLDGLVAGIYNIVFDAKGYSTAVKNGVEVKQKKTIDLGDRLIMQIDKGTQVIVNGSVFFKDGTSVTAAKVEVERVDPDGSTHNVASLRTNIFGEFVFRQPERAAKYRMTVKYKDTTAMKEIEVDSAAVYRIAISLDTSRQDK